MDTVKQLQNALDRAVESGEELGCQLAVYKDGKLFCSLCSGFTSGERDRYVTGETLFPVFSVGKGVVTTLIHLLYEQGKIDYDAPVTQYWPEYGSCGKAETRLWHILSHRSGLYDFPADFAPDDKFDWERSSLALAGMEPLDTIGGMHHYHAQTYGVLAGRIAELATGRALNSLLKEYIFDQLGTDAVFFGLPADRFPECARIVADDPGAWQLEYNSMKILGGFNPSSNGCMNALSIARIYASLIGSGLHGKRLLKDETVDNATVLKRAPEDPVMPGEWAKFGLGYALCGPEGDLGRIFGHGGACGSEGFADKASGLAVGFTKNKASRNHPNHPLRNQISRILGIPERIW